MVREWRCISVVWEREGDKTRVKTMSVLDEVGKKKTGPNRKRVM